MVGDKALEAAPTVNEVAIAAADSFAPVAAFQYLIDYVHLYTGFEWWASIAATALLIRLIFLPLRIHQLRVDKQFYHVILNMAKNVPSFVIGGTLWFTDLTTPDHSLRLPLLFALTYWFRIEFDPRQEKPGQIMNMVIPPLVTVIAVIPGLPSIKPLRFHRIIQELNHGHSYRS